MTNLVTKRPILCQNSLKIACHSLAPCSVLWRGQSKVEEASADEPFWFNSVIETCDENCEEKFEETFDENCDEPLVHLNCRNL